jgi:RNA polymerase primary sigma factor
MDRFDTISGASTLELEQQHRSAEMTIADGETAFALPVDVDASGVLDEAIGVPGLDALDEDFGELRPHADGAPFGRPSAEREKGFAIAVEEARRQLLLESIESEFVFRQVMQLGEQLRAGAVRLRSVVDIGGRPKSSTDDDSDADEGGAKEARRRTLAAFDRMARLRGEYLRVSRGPRIASAGALADARRKRLVACFEELSIHPKQLRRIDQVLEQLLGAVAAAERSLREELHRAHRRSNISPRSALAWRRAAAPLLAGRPTDSSRAAGTREALERLAQVERGAGEPLRDFHQRATAFRNAHRRLEAAKNQMVRANIGLVHAMAGKYVRRGIDWADLVQEAAVGLMRAVEKFDHRRGFRFSTYATWWVRQAMTRAIADHGRTIRVPVHMNEHLVRLRRLSIHLSQKLGREPTLDEVAGVAGLSAEKATEILRHNRPTTSLDAPVGPEGDTSLIELVPDAGAADPGTPSERKELKHVLENVLSDLSEREQLVLRTRFGLQTDEPRTLEEIGRILGVSRERVRQIEKQALRKLERRGSARGLQVFLQ